MKKAMVVVLLLIGAVMCFAQHSQEMDKSLVGTWRATDSEGKNPIIFQFNANGTATRRQTQAEGEVQCSGQWYTTQYTLLSFMGQKVKMPGKDWVDSDSGSIMLQEYALSPDGNTLNWAGAVLKRQ